MNNLLRNGDFEADWSEEKSHRCLVLPIDGNPYEKDVDNIFTPPGWVTWFVHAAGKWDQPEVRDAWNHIDPHRVHSGEKAILLFTFWRRHHAGFYQQVQVTPGTKLSLSAYAHAWSNTNIPLHSDCTDRPRCSAGVGTQAVAIPTADAPPLTGDPWQDALQNFAFRIGIDPTGGTNPLADTVQWGTPYYIYNNFFRLTAEAVAQAETVTVFLCSVTQWPFKHNDAYWDDAQLTAPDDPPVPPTGLPRIQYARSYVLLPQAYGPEWAVAAMEGGHARRLTIGFSADDAGIGALLTKEAIVVNPQEWEPNSITAFLKQYYPGTKFTAIHASTPQELKQALSGHQPPSEILLWQCHEEWKDEKIASPTCSHTLCQDGCWITNCAMAQRLYGIEPYATPSTVNQALGHASGFSGCATTWASMKPALGLEVVKRSYDEHEVREWLDTGNIAFGEVEPETFLHFVMVTKYQEGRFWMLDPWKNLEGWVDEHYPAGIESWRLIRPFDAPPPPPPPPPPQPTGSLVSLHLQTMREGALEFVARVKPRVVKVFQLENGRGVKAANPNTIVVLRYFTTEQHLEGDLRAAAQAYVDTFTPSLLANHKYIKYVEAWNETVATNDRNGIKRAVEFDYWFAEALNALGLPDTHPLLLNVAVGNPHHLNVIQRLLRRLFPSRAPLGPPSPIGPPLLTGTSLPALLAVSEIELMLPAVEQAIKYGGALGYHAYGQAIAPDGDLNDNWEYFAGRALENWDPVFRAHGLYPKYVFTECGAFATCMDGWRASNCLKGDWPRYLAQLTEFSDRIKSWNAAHGNRCLGGTLFTTGGWGWASFEIGKAEMEDPNWPT